MGFYITPEQLESALGPSTFLAIFDDGNVGYVNDMAVTLVIARAHSRVQSRLGRIYAVLPAELPAEIDPLLVSAELDYAVAFSFERHPEYVRTSGIGKTSAQETRAEQTMEDIVASRQQLVDAPPAAVPLTVGGVTTDHSRRVILDNDDGTPNTGDF